jgi:HAD superfamily hydrolase (TIGR01662 family)
MMRSDPRGSAGVQAGGERYDVVIPTVGRPELGRLLRSLVRDVDATGAPGPRSVIVVDDRPSADGPLDVPDSGDVPVVVVDHGPRGGGQGPAASRNRGWRAGTSPWICFVDDDVVIRPGWVKGLADDLVRADASVGAVQGRVHVPLPAGRRPTDRERTVAGLAEARWITADMAVRRAALAEVGGFDERFRRAYREDSDLALRLMDAGWRLAEGERRTDHPVGAATWNVSITSQRGNADDALMHRLHGPEWRARAQAPRGMLRSHVATTAAAVATLAALALRWNRGAALLASTWLACWGRLTHRRTAPGPPDVGEVATMAATSAVLPATATLWAALGRRRARGLAPGGPRDRWGTRRPRAVLFDRDGTLVEDVPYNGDPRRVTPVAGARAALDRLRGEGVAVGMVSNQSGVARGLLTAQQVAAVNARVEDLLGPFDVVVWCPHGPDDRCRCRKPGAGMVLDAAHRVGVPPSSCAVVGDIGSDVEAGLAAGARSVIVPTTATRAEEVADSPEVAGSLAEAVEAFLTGVRLPSGHQLVPSVRELHLYEEHVS